MPYPCLLRTTLALDGDLLAEAEALTGVSEKTALVREALKALIERESARWLARLGGGDPKAKAAPPPVGMIPAAKTACCFVFGRISC